MSTLAERIQEVLDAGYSQVELAKAAGVTKGTSNQWLSGGIKSLKLEYARGISRLTGFNIVWLVTGEGRKSADDSMGADVVATAPDGSTIILEAKNIDRRTGASDRRSRGDEIEIPQFKELGGSMGAGLLLRDQPGEIQRWSVTPDWITKNVKNFTGATNLRIVTGFGDSMRPLYNPGDPLLVDAGVKSVDFDSIYFFRIGDEGFIKRLQRVPGQGLLAISENKSYRDWVITPDMDFQVFARVIKVWCGSDF